MFTQHTGQLEKDVALQVAGVAGCLWDDVRAEAGACSEWCREGTLMLAAQVSLSGCPLSVSLVGEDAFFQVGLHLKNVPFGGSYLAPSPHVATQPTGAIPSLYPTFRPPCRGNQTLASPPSAEQDCRPGLGSSTGKYGRRGQTSAAGPLCKHCRPVTQAHKQKQK